MKGDQGRSQFMKKRTIKRSILSALVVTIVLMATLLTACSSGETTETSAKEETAKTEVTEETTEVEQTEETAEPEPMEESAPESEAEDSKYSGIDMESTLPGLEWLAFVVVYNDATHKKVIVNEGDEVEFSRSSDVLALYTPNNEAMTAMAISGRFNKDWIGSNELPDSTTSKRVIMCKKESISGDSEEECGADVMINGELQRYKFVLKFVD